MHKHTNINARHFNDGKYAHFLYYLTTAIIWNNTRFFYKKLGSAPSNKSFLISHENFAIIVLKVS